MRATWLLAALALAGWSGSAAAQDRRLTERLDPTTARQVAAVVDSAGRARLPTEPLVQKALEGAAKRVPSPRIVAAVSALYQALGRARQALGGPAEEQEIVTGALWLRSGGGPGDLTRLKQRAGRRSVAVAITVLTDLVQRGVAPNEAVSGLDRLLGNGLADGELLQVRDRVARAVLDGSPAGGALEGEVARLAPPGGPP